MPERLNSFEAGAREMGEEFNGIVLTPPADALEIFGHTASDQLDAEAHKHMKLLVEAAADAYRHFGGTETQWPLTVTSREVKDLVTDLDWEEDHMVWGWGENIAVLVNKYVSGLGADYETFLKY